jgi:hypothetical protein
LTLGDHLLMEPCLSRKAFSETFRLISNSFQAFKLCWQSVAGLSVIQNEFQQDVFIKLCLSVLLMSYQFFSAPAANMHVAGAS